MDIYKDYISCRAHGFQLHHLGISHGDLRCGNIIIDTSDSCQSRYYFLDNERTVRYRKLPQRKRLKNLVQLNMISESFGTKTDRLRFFKAYLRENPDLEPQKKMAHAHHKQNAKTSFTKISKENIETT